MEKQPAHSSIELIKLIVSNIATLAAAYLLFTSNIKSNDNDLLKTVIARVEVLERRNEELQSKNIILMSDLRDNVNRVDLYQSFLDALHFPAWIKRKDDDGEFRMVVLNNAYAERYGKSKYRYIGATDAEVWGEEMAKGFRIADDVVFQSRRYILTQEYFPENGNSTENVSHNVWKFSVKLGADVYGVGGIVIIEPSINY